MRHVQHAVGHACPHSVHWGRGPATWSPLLSQAAQCCREGNDKKTPCLSWQTVRSSAVQPPGTSDRQCPCRARSMPLIRAASAPTQTHAACACPPALSSARWRSGAPCAGHIHCGRLAVLAEAAPGDALTRRYVMWAVECQAVECQALAGVDPDRARKTSSRLSALDQRGQESNVRQSNVFRSGANIHCAFARRRHPT